jgi:CSLREA domain-containing protein
VKIQPKSSAKKPLAKPRSAAVAQALESRILFSADTAALALTATEPAAQVQSQAAIPASTANQTAVSQLFVLDLRIEDAQGMLAGLQKQQAEARAKGETFEILTLDWQDDGIAKISEALQAQGNYSALHLIGHGDDGMMLLGSSWLDQAALRSRADDFSAWSNGLSSDADILIYGCDFAGSAVGQQSVQALAQITGADVAASVDTTSNALQGGNWVLEFQEGTITTSTNGVEDAGQLWRGKLTTFIVTNVSDVGGGSLRQAILNANANAGSDTITFNIGGGGVQSIDLQSALPSITESVLIDGTTITGYAVGAPLVVLNGSAAGSLANGLEIMSTTPVTIRGLVINNFDGNGISIENGGAHLITSNFIGISETGNDARSNGGNGIYIKNSINNTIGGTTAVERNVISANIGCGIYIGNESDGNIVSGNFIGINATGNAPLGNTREGVEVFYSENVVIGGSTGSWVANVISGNGKNGIGIYNGSVNTFVLGNIIGLNANATASIANAQSGIAIANSNSNVIGGSAASQGNIISGNAQNGIYINQSNGNTVVNNWIGRNALNNATIGNGRSGIFIDVNGTNNKIGGVAQTDRNVISGSNLSAIRIGDTSTGNALIGNSIFENSQLGIDLRTTPGVTANDSLLDLDTGANGLQNYPLLHNALISGPNIYIAGEISSSSNATFLIHFYGNAAGAQDISGYGQGTKFLGSTTVTTDAAGFTIFNATLDSSGLVAGGSISSLATVDLGGGNYGNTSEFSQNVQITIANTAPIVTLNSASAVFTEAGSAIFIDPTASISDVDSTDFAGGVLQLTITSNSSNRDVLRINNQGSGAGQISVSGNSVLYEGTSIGNFNASSSNLAVTLNANATAVATQALLRNLTFSTLGQDPLSATRTATVSLSDGDGGLSTPQARNIAIAVDNTLWVTTTNDLADGDTSSIFNLLANRGSDGEISLREAIEATNNTSVAGVNQINFDIAGTGPRTINVTARLPTITRQIVIDGKTQSGYASSPIIQIDGNLILNADGLHLGTGSSGSYISGLAITNFLGAGSPGGHGLLIESSSNIIESNYLGLDTTGAVAGNWVGLVLTGGASNNIVGGTAATKANVISSNTQGGISITGVATTGNKVIGNYIGVGSNGLTERPNAFWGITVWNNSSGNTIGGTAVGSGNIIRSNADIGIVVEPSASAAILRNSISGNNNIGIDLNADDLTANDLGDTDTGANGLQNFPVISSVTSSSGNTTIFGLLSSNPNQTFRLEYFSAPTANANGHGGGTTYLGFENVTTDATGTAYISTVLTGVNVPIGFTVTATATLDSGGSNFVATSEFAKSVAVNAVFPGAIVSPLSTTVTSESGSPTSFTVRLSTAPTSTVTIPVDSDKYWEGNVSIRTLVFTPANWNIDQTVTVTGADDSVIDGSRNYNVVLGSAISSDPAYEFMDLADIAVTNLDNDTASIIVVTTTADIADGDTSSFYALIRNQGADGKVSLREAIEAANNTPNGTSDADLIQFNISDVLTSGEHIITLNSALPIITDSLTIDASTEPDWALNANRPVVVIDGNGIMAPVIHVNSFADGNRIQGLIIRNSGASGILIDSGSEGNKIVGNYIGSLRSNGTSSSATLGNANGIDIRGHGNYIGGTNAGERNVVSGNGFGIAIQGVDAFANHVMGNYIGTTASGSVALGNIYDGVFIGSGARANIIGGDTATYRNVISGNLGDGIDIAGNGSSSNVVRGNYIGVSADGLSNITPTSNEGSGINVYAGANDTLIGGSNVGQGNWIAGMGYRGIYIDGVSTGTIIQGNRIGTDATGLLNWGVGYSSIFILGGAQSVLIGGTSVASGNILANSGQISANAAGIAIAGSSSNISILGNSIYGSAGLAIDLGDNSVTPNDFNDADIGTNALQNFPVLTSALSSGGNTIIIGTLNSNPNTNFRIEFFSSPTGDVTLHGEAQTYLGFVNVTSNPSGDASFNTTLSGLTLPPGQVVSATATVDLGNGVFGDTSELARNIVSGESLTISGTIYEDINSNGQVADDGVGLQGVLVSVYRDNGDGVIGSGDVIVNNRATNASGQYSFTNLTTGTYWVVTDSRTLRSSSGLNASFSILDQWAEQTYGSVGSVSWNSGSYSYSSAAGQLLGGMRADRSDNGGSLPTAEHVTRVSLSGGDVTSVDYGFSYNVITNTRDGDDVSANNLSIQGSLRQFISNSNALQGTQTSQFRIPSTDSNFANGVAVVTLASAPLPVLADTIIIDGTTQTTWGGNTNAAVLGSGSDVGENPVALSQLQAPEIEIRGRSGNENIFEVQADSTVIRGLALVGSGIEGDFSSSAIEINANNVRIEGNLIGSSATSVLDPGQANRVQAIGVLVLGQATFNNNIFAYIPMSAISIETGGSNSVVSNNEFIGSAFLPSIRATIPIRNASNVQIIGNAFRDNEASVLELFSNASSNIIRNNSLLRNGNLPIQENDAIQISGGSNSNVIEGNLIDGNVSAGISIVGSINNQIGGTLSQQANRIVNNGGGGVSISGASEGNSLLRNVIDNNFSLGIDLGTSGVDTNDLGDIDSGANGLQNYPVLISAVTSGGNLFISGSLSSDTNKTYRIEFFSSSTADLSGHGEAQRYLGFINVSTDAITGIANFNTTLNSVSVPQGASLTATATLAIDLINNLYSHTSEFSQNVATTPPSVSQISGFVVEDPEADGNITASTGLIAQVYLFKDDGDGEMNATDTLVRSALSSSNGSYGFDGLAAGTYWTVVDSRSIQSALNAGFTTANTWWEQSYGAAGAKTFNGTFNYTFSGGELLGGARRDVSDGFDGSASSLVNAEHATRVVLGSATRAIDVNFGFTSSAIVTTLDGDDDVSAPRSKQGSLRQFLQNSSAITGAQSSLFRLTASDANYSASDGVWRLSVNQTLPTLDDGGVLTGSTQTTWGGDQNSGSYIPPADLLRQFSPTPIDNPEIEIIGSGAAATGAAIYQTGAGGRISGLSIYGFADGIITSADGAVIEANFIGANSAATDTINQRLDRGISVLSANAITIRYNLIGYTKYNGIVLASGSNITVTDNTFTTTSLLSGSNGAIQVIGPNAGLSITKNSILFSNAMAIDIGGSQAPLISNNFIADSGLGGVERIGIKIHPDVLAATIELNTITRSHAAIVITGDGTTNTHQIGGVNRGNIIVGNQAEGITLDRTNGVKIQGNKIGVTSSFASLPNAQSGVHVTNLSTNTLIGGISAGEGNVIAHASNSTSTGVAVANLGLQVVILGNSIYQNTAMGISFGADRNLPSVNDANDADVTAGNGPQNHPVISNVQSIGMATQIAGVLNTRANRTYRIEAFRNPAAMVESNGYAEGAEFMGFFNVTTDATGFASFNQSMNAATTIGDKVTLVATEFILGSFTSSSEFSLSSTVGSPPPGITVVSISPLITTEIGGAAQFSVVLDSAPVSSVTINLSSGDVSEGIPNLTSLVFTSANWNVAQVVTVSGVDDRFVDGNPLYSINFAPAISTDPSYSGLATTSLSLTNIDDDTYNTLVVDTTSDASDGDTSSIAALYENKGADDRISLREAILAANNTANGASSDKIHFGITDPLVGGQHTISVLSALTSISDAVLIDGATDSDFAGTPVIVLSGALAGSDVNGISFGSGSATSGIRSLTIDRFSNLGISVSSAPDILIGGAGFGNIITRNTNGGINVDPGSNRIQVIGNAFGTDLGGTALLANGSTNIRLLGGIGAMIGGTTAGSGNLIANSTNGPGIYIDAASSINAILGNSIYNHSGIGIDFGSAGVTPNDVGDGDAGANGLQNYPVLISAVISAGNTTVAGSINSNANTNYRIEFFSSPFSDVSGHGEARTFLGFVNTTTDASGNASFNPTFLGVPVAAGGAITATATVDLGGGNFGSTSEFAANVLASGTPAGVTVSTPSSVTTNEGGSSSQFTVVLDTPPSANVNIPLSVTDASEASLSMTTLVFTAANWNIAQTVTVTGLDDLFIDGNIGYSIITSNVVSADLAYNGMVVSDVSLTNIDNDNYSIVLVDTTDDTIGGDTSSISSLYANKGSDGKISLREAILASNNTANGSQADAILFNIADPLMNGAHTINVLSELPSITDAVFIEGASEPDFNSSINVVELDGTLAGTSNGLVITSDSSHINHLTIRNFSGSGIYGIAVYGNNTIITSNTIDSTGAGGVYVAGTASNTNISANTVANQAKGVIVADAASGVTVSQNDMANVLLPIDLNDDGLNPNDLNDGDFGPNELLNTPVLSSVSTNGSSSVRLSGAYNGLANRTLAIEVFEHGVLGQYVQYVGSFNITTDAFGNTNFDQTLTGTFAAGSLFSATSTDITVAGNNPTSEHSALVSALVPRVFVTPTNALTVNESGSTATFSLVLNTAPTSDVVISIIPSRPGEISLSAGTVTFTSANWFIDQTITVTGLDDFVGDGTQLVSIVTSNTTSADPSYSGLTVDDIIVFNQEIQNVAPVINAPASYSIVEDILGNLSNLGGLSTGLLISDSDVGSGSLNVTLSTTNGVFTLGSTAGLNFLVGDGNADTTMVFEGTPAAINAAIDAIAFAPTQNFFGTATFNVTVNDLGNSGSGGARSTSRMIPINVIAVNDAPILVGTKIATVVEGGAIIVTPSMFALTDVDTNPSDLIFTVRSTSGDGELVRSGISLRVGDSFSQEDINSQLVQFNHFGGELPTANVVLGATERFGISLQDFTLNFAVTAVNDAPTIDAFSGGSVSETAVSGASVAQVSASDVDNNTGLTYTLETDAQGAFNIDASSGAITVRNPASIDFENSQTLTIRVRATDVLGASAERDFVIQVTDVPEFVFVPTDNGNGNGNGNGNNNGGTTTSNSGNPSNENNANTGTSNSNGKTDAIDQGTSGVSSRSDILVASATDSAAKLSSTAQVSDAKRSTQIKIAENTDNDTWVDPNAAAGSSKKQYVQNSRSNTTYLLEQEEKISESNRRRYLNSDALDYLLNSKNKTKGLAVVPPSVFLADFNLPENAQSMPIQENSIDKLPTNRSYSIVIDTIEYSGMALSVGVVAWATRAGGLLAALLTAIPAWKGLDPLLVLSPSQKARRDTNGGTYSSTKGNANDDEKHFDEFTDTEIRNDEEAVRAVI